MNIGIKRHGNPSDVEGTKLKFYKNDMIFGKRRAYQCKASLTECDNRKGLAKQEFLLPPKSEQTRLAKLL
jgi:hypothetical protein